MVYMDVRVQDTGHRAHVYPTCTTAYRRVTWYVLGARAHLSMGIRGGQYAHRLVVALVLVPALVAVLLVLVVLVLAVLPAVVEVLL